MANAPNGSWNALHRLHLAHQSSKEQDSRSGHGSRLCDSSLRETGSWNGLSQSSVYRTLSSRREALQRIASIGNSRCKANFIFFKFPDH